MKNYYITQIKGKMVSVIEIDGKYYDADTLNEINQPVNLEDMPLRLQDFYKDLIKNCIFEQKTDTV